MAGALALSFTLALACLSALATAREDPFFQEKTYAPPYGAGGSPVTPTPDVPYTPPYSPTPSGGSPLVPATPDVPYSPTPAVPDVSYTPTPYAPTDPAPATPAPTTPGTCSWWSKNTSSFPDLISIFTTILDLFTTLTGGGAGGSSTMTPSIGSIFGNQMTVYQGLTNTRSDGYGALARQGSAAILNAYANPRQYPYSAQQVRMQFRSAMANQQTAFQMARVFENANNAVGMRH